LLRTDSLFDWLTTNGTSNLLFDLIAEADGQTPLPPRVVDNLREMNLIVARTIDELSLRNGRSFSRTIWRTTSGITPTWDDSSPSPRTEAPSSYQSCSPVTEMCSSNESPIQGDVLDTS
jgi:hypothetical protein